MTLYKYVVTAQKPTATQFALRASFTARDETNLILGRNTRIEIYTLEPDGLKPTLEFNINGSIRAMEEYKPRGRDKASIFIMTTRRKFCILTFSERSRQILTEASGEIMPTGPPFRLGDLLGCLDPTSQYFAVRINECLISIVTSEAFTQRALKEMYLRNGPHIEHLRRGFHGTVQPQIDLSLGYNRIVNMTFLHGTTQPTLAVLYDNYESRRLVETFVLNPENREFEPSSKLIEDLSPADGDTTLISLPLPLGGVVLIGRSTIRYLSPGRKAKAISNKGCAVSCFTMLTEDGTRILLGDCNYGGLFLLNLVVSGRYVESMSIVKLGKVSIPSSLACLDNDVIYVGSSFGDCQVVHIRNCSVNNMDNVLKVVEEYPNLAPVHDFYNADVDKQLITCSGFGYDAAPRIIRHGVGLNELATSEIGGVLGIYTLRPYFGSSYDDVLVFSFINETRVLQLHDSEMIQLDTYSAFALNERTLATGNVLNAGIVQITDRCVILMEVGVHGKLLDVWQPPDGSKIVVAALNASQCVISLGFGRLIALAFPGGKKIQEAGTTKLRYDVSCIDITPSNSPRDPETSVVAVGVWKKIGVRLLAWPSLQVLAAENLSGVAVPRSLLMAKFEGISYLLVAMGDGGFYNFKLDDINGRLWDKKRSFLGKMPISLGIFFSNDTMHVFAASDKPSVIHSRNRKLIYSNVNVKDVRYVTSFNSAAFPDAVALVTKDSLVIGQMEEIQKLHISKIPSIDMPLQIVHQEPSRTFAILTSNFSAGPSPRPNDITSAIVLQDDQSFQILDRIYLKYLEHILTMTSAVLDVDGNEYYVLGTGSPNSEFETKATGRIIVISVTPERRLKVVGQVRTKSMVDCVTPFQGKIVASIGSTLCLYEWTWDAEGNGNLKMVCSHSLPSYCKTLAVDKDVIAAGDLVSSLGTFRYDPQKQVLHQVGRDFERKEITAVAALGNNLYIGGEESGNLLLFELKPADKEKELDEALEIVGQWNFGDRIVRFRRGSLGTTTTENVGRSVAPSLVFCSANGSIGVIADLTADLYKLLSQMQDNMNRIVPAVGDLSHAEWRNISLPTGEDNSRHFIDGDLIESFLDLTPQQMQMVVDGRNGGRPLEKSVEDLCKVVEELMSVHS